MDPLSQKLSRADFPAGFTFGVSTSAYQIEGAAFEDGRGMSIWDSFSHIPGNINDKSNGDLACDHYHQYEGDIQRMVELGIDAYRLSISWSRILPDGSGAINYKGVAFYNKLINCLIYNGIEPYVTLYHWDMPQTLENNPDVKGWRSKEIRHYFASFAETCFILFGDRVKNWITFNQTSTLAVNGYGNGTVAPGRCSAVFRSRRSKSVGDSSTEPYIVAHNILLSHAAAVKIYRTRYQKDQNGRIGITINSDWYEPYTDHQEDIDAAQRCIEFELCWILDPILFGEYPQSVKFGVGSRLPVFTEEELIDLKGSVDFLGFNYYTAKYAQNAKEELDPEKRWFETDRMATVTFTGVDGQLIGEAMGPIEFGRLYNCPWALPKLLEWMEHRYGREQFQNLPIIITENGTTDKEFNFPMKKALNDSKRIEYLSGTLQHLHKALKSDKYNVQGFFVWSLIDNFEWKFGLSCRFGLYYVDYTDNMKRYPKKSAEWYRDFLQNKCLSSIPKCQGTSRGCLGSITSGYLSFLLQVMNGQSMYLSKVLSKSFWEALLTP